MAARDLAPPFAFRGTELSISVATSPPASRREIVILQGLVGAFLLMRLWFQLNGGVLGDEAYYWMWGQHPGWSYFDHPPLHAWLLGAVSILGWSPFTLRLLTWVSLAIVLAVLWAWGKRLNPADPQLWFWRATAVYLSCPIFFVMTASAYNDHLLVALAFAAVHCFVVFIERQETNKGRALPWLFAAAALLGLATLTKYNAVLVGLGFALTIIIRPRLRTLLLTPWPWLAALLAIAMQAPVLWWNLIEGGATLRYHLDERWAGASDGLHWANTLRFLALSLLFWSPFLVWPLVKLIRTPIVDSFGSPAKTVALAIFAASSAILLVTSVLLDAYFYWNIVALVAVTPLVAMLTNRWLRALHYAYGLLWAVVVVIHFSVMPVTTLLGMKDYGVALNYNWEAVAERMTAQREAHPEALLAATRYSTTAQLGFALGTTDVVKLSPEHSQWDYWQEGRDFTGTSALILADEPDGSPTIEFLRSHFETLEMVDSFTADHLGKPLYDWRIFLGTGWKP